MYPQQIINPPRKIQFKKLLFKDVRHLKRYTFSDFKKKTLAKKNTLVAKKTMIPLINFPDRILKIQTWKKCVVCGSIKKGKKNFTCCKIFHTQTFIEEQNKNQNKLTNLQSTVVTFDYERDLSVLKKVRKESGIIPTTIPKPAFAIAPQDYVSAHDPRILVDSFDNFFMGRVGSPIDVPLACGSIRSRFANGRNNIWRKITIPLKPDGVGRCVAACDPTLASDGITLPKSVGKSLGFPLGVVVVRFPSLETGNCTFHRVKKFTDSDTIGLPMAILERQNADLDGDEVDIITIDQNYLFELENLLSPKYNIMSLGHLKIKFVSDVKLGLGYCENGKPFWKKIIQEIMDIYIGTGNSNKCFKMFSEYEQLGLQNSYNLGPVTLKNLEMFAELQATRYRLPHHFAFLKSIGTQRFAFNDNPLGYEIENSFSSGMNKREFICHMQAGRDAMNESGGGSISVVGYDHTKLAFCLPESTHAYDNTIRSPDQKLMADYFSDLHPLKSNKITTSAFKHLLNTTLKNYKPTNKFFVEKPLPLVNLISKIKFHQTPFQQNYKWLIENCVEGIYKINSKNICYGVQKIDENLKTAGLVVGDCIKLVFKSEWCLNPYVVVLT